MDALEELIELTKLRIPRGKYTYRDETITNTKRIDFIKNHPYQPIFSINIMNKGPDDIYMVINGGIEIKINAYEIPPTFDFKRPSIRHLDFRMESGESTRIKILGFY